MLWVSSPQAYFIADTDLRKDPNTQRTILSRMLDISQRLLTRRGLDMPRHVVFHVPCFKKSVSGGKLGVSVGGDFWLGMHIMLGEPVSLMSHRRLLWAAARRQGGRQT